MLAAPYAVDGCHLAHAVAFYRGIVAGFVEAGVAVQGQVGGNLSLVGVVFHPGGAVEGDVGIEACFAVFPLLQHVVGLVLLLVACQVVVACGIGGVVVLFGHGVHVGRGDARVLLIVGVVHDAQTFVRVEEVHHLLCGAESQTATDGAFAGEVGVVGSHLVAVVAVVGKADEDLLFVVVAVVYAVSGLAVGLVEVDGTFAACYGVELVLASEGTEELFVGSPCGLPLGLRGFLREELLAVFVAYFGIVAVAVEQRTGGVEQYFGFEGFAGTFVYAAQVGAVVAVGQVLSGEVQFGSDVFDALVHGVTLFQQLFQRGVQCQGIFAQHHHRSVGTEEVEVVEGTQGAGLRFPHQAVVGAGFEAAVYVGYERACLGDAFVVVDEPEVNPAGRGVGDAHGPLVAGVPTPGDVRFERCAGGDGARLV